MKFLTRLYLVAMLSQTSLGATTSPTVREFNATPIREIAIHSSSSDVLVEGTGGAKILIQVYLESPKENCELNFSENGSKLLVELKNAGMFKKCRGRIEVKSPERMNLELKSGSGDTRVKNIHGKLKARSGSGDLAAEGRFAKLDLLRGSGRVTVRGIEDEAEISTGSGDMELEFASGATQGDVQIKAGSGDTTIYLPAQATVQLHHRSAAGDFESDFPIASKGNFEVSVISGSGDLKLKKRKSF